MRLSVRMMFAVIVCAASSALAAPPGEAAATLRCIPGSVNFPDNTLAVFCGPLLVPLTSGDWFSQAEPAPYHAGLDVIVPGPRGVGTFAVITTVSEPLKQAFRSIADVARAILAGHADPNQTSRYVQVRAGHGLTIVRKAPTRTIVDTWFVADGSAYRIRNTVPSTVFTRYSKIVDQIIRDASFSTTYFSEAWHAEYGLAWTHTIPIAVDEGALTVSLHSVDYVHAGQWQVSIGYSNSSSRAVTLVGVDVLLSAQRGSSPGSDVLSSPGVEWQSATGKNEKPTATYALKLKSGGNWSGTVQGIDLVQQPHYAAIRVRYSVGGKTGSYVFPYLATPAG